MPKVSIVLTDTQFEWLTEYCDAYHMKKSTFFTGILRKAIQEDVCLRNWTSEDRVKSECRPVHEDSGAGATWQDEHGRSDQAHADYLEARSVTAAGSAQASTQPLVPESDRVSLDTGIVELPGMVPPHAMRIPRVVRSRPKQERG
jgi:hypothetical protein